MCGELKPWQYLHHVVIRLDNPATPGVPNTNAPVNKVTLPLGRFLQHIDEVRLTEYCVVNGVSASNLWRISFAGSSLSEEVSTNAAGRGHVIMVPTAALTHVIYDAPRVLSVDERQGLAQINIHVTDATGADVSFDNMTIFLTFVLNNPDWSGESVREADRNRLEWWRSQRFSSRFTP